MCMLESEMFEKHRKKSAFHGSTKSPFCESHSGELKTRKTEQVPTGLEAFKDHLPWFLTACFKVAVTIVMVREDSREVRKDRIEIVSELGCLFVRDFVGDLILQFHTKTQMGSIVTTRCQDDDGSWMLCRTQI